MQKTYEIQTKRGPWAVSKNEDLRGGSWKNTEVRRTPLSLAGQSDSTQVGSSGSDESFQKEYAERVSSTVFEIPLETMCVKQCVISMVEPLDSNHVQCSQADAGVEFMNFKWTFTLSQGKIFKISATTQTSFPLKCFKTLVFALPASVCKYDPPRFVAVTSVISWFQQTRLKSFAMKVTDCLILRFSA